MGAIIKNPPKPKLKDIIIGIIVIIVAMLMMGELGLIMAHIQPK